MKQVSTDGDTKRTNRSLPRSRPLNTQQIATRLGVSFGLLVALLITIGDLGMHRMQRINDDLQDMMGKQWTKLRLSQEAVTYSNRNSRITMEIFLFKDQERIDELLTARAENTRKISGLVADLGNLCASEEERKLMQAVSNARAPYINSYQRALHLLVDEKKNDEALAVMTQQTTQAMLTYHDAWEKFVVYQGDQLELAARQNGQRFAAARTIALFVIVLAVVIAAGVSLLATRGMVREMTARLREEKEALRAAHQEAEVFINAVPSILIAVDRGARITRWNSFAASALGMPHAEAIGKQLADCGIQWQTPDMGGEIRQWSSQQESQRRELQFERNGQTRLLGLTITPVQMANENMATLVIGSDITDQRAMEGQLRQAQKLESVGQLAAGIAHEINTPTQYIGDNVRFLKDSFTDLKDLLASYERLLEAAKTNTLSAETVQEVIDASERADTPYLLEEIPKAIEQTLEGVTRVAKLVSAMKEFSHPGSKEKTAVDLNHAIESTITVARNEWKYKADLETEFDASLPLVSCLPSEFNQVILNMIVNAVHAIADVVAKGGPEKGKITVRTRKCEQWAEIQIQDTGTGIPEKARARIFDPFYTTKEIGKGTGQGLAIARSVIVDKHGGTIHFETEEGKGTTFIIRLPLDGTALAAKAVTA